jgi:ADP-heptose:LPS heptosyltransferase
MCRLAGLNGEVTLRPYLALTAAERVAAPRLPRQIAIQASGLSAAIPYSTKEWGAERFAAVARKLAPGFSLVQLGSPNDPLLPNVALDLRGKTTLREAAAVQAASLCFIGLEGFLTHLARAVDCPAVVIHGGRAPAGIFDYPANINLYTRPACSPCGLRDGCPHDLQCLVAITAGQVAAAVDTLILRPRDSLPVDVVSA